MRRYLGNLKYTFVSLQRLKYRMIFVVVNFISNFSSKIKWCICCSTNSVWALCWKLVNRFLFAALSPHGFPQAWGVMLPKPIYKAHLDIEFHLFFQVPLGHGAIRSVCGLLRASADMVARDERWRSRAGMSPAPPSLTHPCPSCKPVLGRWALPPWWWWLGKACLPFNVVNYNLWEKREI